MKPSAIILAWSGAALAAAPSQQPHPAYIFSNPPASAAAGFRIPTSYESAVMGRRILALTPLGTLATVFPNDSSPHAAENRPPGLGGMPHGLMDYVADCEGGGNPTLLALDIETHFKNVRAGSNISLAVRWAPPHPPAKRISFFPWLFGGGGEEHDPLPYSAANLPRFSLLGYVERIVPGGDDATGELAECFVKAHPDARYWLPGNRIHASHFVRLVVTQAYWIGGFGDRAYIGWLPLSEWRNVTRAEWEELRLPGEKKGWKEWMIGDL